MSNDELITESPKENDIISHENGDQSIDQESLTAESIVFEFEEFLKIHEENLPEGLDPQYLAYVDIVEHPLRNLRKLPKALVTLPMNAMLYQSWKTIYKLLGLIVLFSLPSLILMMRTSIATTGSIAVGIILVIFMLIGVAASPAYLKLLYGILNDMVEGKSHRWLIEAVEKPFTELYQIRWNYRILTLSYATIFLLDFQFIYYDLFENGVLNYKGFFFILWWLALWTGHFGLTFMLYLSITSYRYVVLNTRIYDLLLVKIIDRARGYTEGHESILSKKNYEVVGVLSDTPGLSIRSLSDIPIIGLVASTLVANAILFIAVGPYLMSLTSAFPDFKIRTNIDDTGLTWILLISLIISLFAAFRAVVTPIVKVWWVIRRFKAKALTELDPYLFDEITGVALNRDSEISNETQVLYMLRNYIYIMKPSPLNPIRLFQIGLFLILYVANGIPILVRIGKFLGGIF